MHTDKYTVQDIIAVVVLYEVDLCNSETIVSLDESAKQYNVTLDVFVYDNSQVCTIDCYKDRFTNLNLVYKHDKTNPGVSAAYNFCFQEYKNRKEVILLFDQDSQLPIDLLSRYVEALNTPAAEEISLFAPVLMGKDEVVWSPARYMWHKGFHIRQKKLLPGLASTCRKTVLNSGLMVKIDTLAALDGFSEDLFYYSDHDFFLRFSKKNKTFYILPVTLNHDISSACNDGKNDALKRFEILCENAKKFGFHAKSGLPLLWLFFQAIRLVLRYRDIKFLLIQLRKVRD